MRTCLVATFCAAIAAGLLALAVSTAVARTFSLDNQDFRWTFNNIELAMGELVTTCKLTLEGSLHSRTIAKVAGSLIGHVTSVRTGECAPAVTILTETLPWHVRYQSFSGRLPDTTLVLVSVRFNLRQSVCLLGTDLEFRVVRNPTSRELTAVVLPIQEASLTGLFCPEVSAVLRSNGNGSSVKLVSPVRVTVTLI
jgi:hypothetical protein